MNWAEWFYYKDGELFNRVTRNSRALQDARVGSLLGNYLSVMVMGHNYLVHRIIWEMHNGAIPEHLTVDHKDGNKLNNNITNLRLATTCEQQHNVGLQCNNTSGFKGVYYRISRNKWYGQLKLEGKRYCTSLVDSAEEAHKLLCSLRNNLHGEFARHV